MTCVEFQRRLSAYTDGELSPGSCWKVELHLRRCPECAGDPPGPARCRRRLAGGDGRDPRSEYITGAVMFRLPAMPPAGRRFGSPIGRLTSPLRESRLFFARRLLVGLFPRPGYVAFFTARRERNSLPGGSFRRRKWPGPGCRPVSLRARRWGRAAGRCVSRGTFSERWVPAFRAVLISSTRLGQQVPPGPRGGCADDGYAQRLRGRCPRVTGSSGSVGLDRDRRSRRAS